jgi:hypothetical protein
MILTHNNRPEKYEVIFIRDNKEVHYGIKDKNFDIYEASILVKSLKDGKEIEAYGWWFKEIN